jgi:hypothetical protein
VQTIPEGHRPGQLIELHSLYRLRVTNEDTLVHYRLFWCLTAEAALFVFFTAVLSSNFVLPFVLKDMLVVGIGIAGILIAVAALIAIRAAFREMDRISRVYEQKVLPLFSDISIPLPGLKGDEPLHWAGKLYPFVLPWITIIAWGLIVLIALGAGVYQFRAVYTGP